MIEPVPSYRYPIPSALGMLAFRGERLEVLGQTRSEYERNNEAALSVIRGLKNIEGVSVFDTSRVLCGASNCALTQNGVALYFDQHHLSLVGARLVANAIRADFLRQPNVPR